MTRKEPGKKGQERQKLSVSDRKTRVEEMVKGMLQPAHYEKAWSELEAEANEENMSPSTVSRCLKKFVRMGLVSRRVDSSVYPPRVYYRWIDRFSQSGSMRFVSEDKATWPFPVKFSEKARLSEELDLVGDIVESGKFKGVTGSLCEKAINVNLLFMKAALPAILHASLGSKGPYEHKANEPATEETIAKRLKQMRKDSHELVDELLDIEIRPWIHKLLSLLWIFGSDSKSILEEAGEPLLKEGIEALKGYDAALRPYRKQKAG